MMRGFAIALIFCTSGAVAGEMIPPPYHAPLENKLRKHGVNGLSESDAALLHEYRKAQKEYVNLQAKYWAICTTHEDINISDVQPCKDVRFDVSKSVLENGMYYHVPVAERDEAQRAAKAIFKKWNKYEDER